ncbi:MAG: alpha/beta hydrolase [Myxococcales bacterium]|nr:MAG: alpha/beta hydrolase [Myxococcales bacterium]
MSQRPAISQTRIRVQFAHGLESSPAGSKARILAEHFDALTPEMDTSDFESCVDVHSAALRSFRPDLLVGSSFGGAVAVELLRRALWRGPTLLLAQAALHRRPEARLPESVAIWLVHGLYDELIDPDESRRLAATGSPDFVRLTLVDDDHRLAASVAEGRLVEWVRDLAAWRPQLR